MNFTAIHHQFIGWCCNRRRIMAVQHVPLVVVRVNGFMGRSFVTSPPWGSAITERFTGTSEDVQRTNFPLIIAPKWIKRTQEIQLEGGRKDRNRKSVVELSHHEYLEAVVGYLTECFTGTLSRVSMSWYYILQLTFCRCSVHQSLIKPQVPCMGTPLIDGQDNDQFHVASFQTLNIFLGKVV